MKFIQAFEKKAEDLGSALGAAFARRKAGVTPGMVTPPPPAPANVAPQANAFAGIRSMFGG